MNMIEKINNIETMDSKIPQPDDINGLVELALETSKKREEILKWKEDI